MPGAIKRAPNKVAESIFPGWVPLKIIWPLGSQSCVKRGACQCAGITIGSPLFFISTTRNLAGWVALALRETV